MCGEQVCSEYNECFKKLTQIEGIYRCSIPLSLKSTYLTNLLNKKKDTYMRNSQGKKVQEKLNYDLIKLPGKIHASKKL